MKNLFNRRTSIDNIDADIRALRQRHWRLVEQCASTAEVDGTIDDLLEIRLTLMEVQ